MNPRQALLDVLAHKAAARPLVVCPGGMMSLAVTEVMAASGVSWPEAHKEERAMLRLALAMQQASGFDNLAMPFCMTVEAEAYGADVDLGNDEVQPRVRGTVLADDGATELQRPGFKAGRAGVLLKALRLAKREKPELPLVGNLVGPFSLLGMLCDPLKVLRWTRRRGDLVHRHMERITEDLCEFGRLQKDAGADVVCIAEPTATGEILGGAIFRAFVLPCLDRLVKSLRSEGLAVIVHICGDVKTIEPELLELQADALSFDSMVNIVSLKQKNPPWEVMGNVDAFLLERGPVDAIERRSRRLVEGGVRLLAPACGVIPATPVSHLKAMRNAANSE